MASLENNARKERKDEKRELCSAWEGSGSDNAPNGENMFYGFQKTKQKIKQKCRYLDEGSIVVAPHLLSQSWSSDSQENAVEERSCSRHVISPKNTPPIKSPLVLVTESKYLSQSTSNTGCLPANTSMTSAVVSHKQNRIYSLSPAKPDILELKRRMPLIRWAPATTRVQITEELVRWRCKAFASVNCIAATDEHLCKGTSTKRLEWSHRNVSHCQPFNNIPLVSRSKPLTQGVSRLNVGHSGVQVHERRVEKSSEAKTLSSEDTMWQVPHDQVLYNCLWDTVQAGKQGHHTEPGQQEDGHMLQSEHGNISISCSNVSWLSDMLCTSRHQGNSKPSIPSHNVNLFHILEVLQKKQGIYHRSGV